MSDRALRALGVGLVTTAGAGVMAPTAMMSSAFAYGEVPPEPADPTTIGLVMGGTGNPLPGIDFPGYVQTADTLYIHPNFPDTKYPIPTRTACTRPSSCTRSPASTPCT